MKTIKILINGKSYDVNLDTGIIRTYTFSRGSDESGDIEGYEDVGKIVGGGFQAEFKFKWEKRS